MTTPNNCVVLAVDPGESSGWCARYDHPTDAFYRSGQLDPFSAATTEVCGYASCMAYARDVPCVFVIERPWGGRMHAVNAVPAHGAWRLSWNVYGGRKSHVVKVHPSKWRAAVLGTARLDRTSARQREMVTAKALQKKLGTPHAIHPDEAAAICIAHWATYAPEVEAVLPKKYRMPAPR